MGRRKQKKVVRTRRKLPKLDNEFNCPFCHHSKTIGIKMDRQRGIGDLACRICGVCYTMKVTKLDEAVDVFSSWVDKCIEVNEEIEKTDEKGMYGERGRVRDYGDDNSAKNAQEFYNVTYNNNTEDVDESRYVREKVPLNTDSSSPPISPITEIAVHGVRKKDSMRDKYQAKELKKDVILIDKKNHAKSYNNSKSIFIEKDKSILTENKRRRLNRPIISKNDSDSSADEDGGALFGKDD